jgi:adenosyl cobinamide kinase/adenosyl cobinamide phosphate guanylyltransferase
VPLTFLLGGARSGKSALAVRLAAGFDGSVTFVATAEPRDDEMRSRIAAHRDTRPKGWATLEAPRDLADGVATVREDSPVVLDCLTLWVSNALEDGATDGAVLDEARLVAVELERRRAPSIVISNEVGLGIVPMNALARRYRDVLGRVNAVVAEVASRSYLVVAGRALSLSDPSSALAESPPT